MAVTNNFKSSALDLNGKVSLSQPTALVWGPDGRLYITEVDGGVKVLTVAFGDKNPLDADQTAQFYVTHAATLDQIKSIPNFNDDGTSSAQKSRQVTGIDVTPQFDAGGNPVLIGGKPAVTIYVTSSDSRIGAGTNGADSGLDTNSGTITRLTQTGPNTWTAVDLVRGLARSEENHALNGLEIIQTLDAQGKLVSERMILAAGGNANSGAPSNNFAGQAEQPLSGAILEIDLDMLKAMPVKTDPSSGRAYVYDAPTLDDPSRPNLADGVDVNDPFGGNDGFNSAKFIAGGPIRIYSTGYRNSYDVEVTEDGRVFTYDNGANGTWGGRPIGEAGDNGGTIDFLQAAGYIATNLNNGDGNSNDKINLVNWKPSNKDQLHEVTRSDDLAGRALSAGQGGATTYEDPLSGHTLVYGGHPNPTRAEGSRAGLLFSPGKGSDDAFLLVSNVDSFGNGGGSDYEEVVEWLAEVEAANPKPSGTSIYGIAEGGLTSRVLAVTPGVLYDIYKLAAGGGAAVVAGSPAPVGGTLLGRAGLPSDIADIVAFKNPIEGNYLEAGKTDGAIDTGNGSINGLTEYTSTVFDQGGVKMSGAIIAVSLGGSYIIMGRDAEGVMPTGVNAQGFTVAALRTTFPSGGAPLGLASIGDDFGERGLAQAFQGSIWSAIYKQNGPLIEILQPNNGAVPLAGSVIVNETDTDGDGVSYLHDPFVFSAENGYKLAAGQSLVLDFSPLNKNFLDSFSSTGLLGAALDRVTPNQDARTAEENFAPDQQRPGLFDNGGNIIPGGNAPIFQIKKVADGTVVGAANTARDAMHTGIRPDADVKRISAVVDVKNWLPESGTPLTGQLTGMMFGDGTQANFLRIVFGGVAGVGPGLEVGYEIGDANYTVLARIALPQLLSGSVPEIALRLEISKIGQSGGFDVSVGYKLAGQAEFTAVPLLGGAGFKLPVGVLRDVLTGAHTITSGGPSVPSGAAVGFLAEDVPGGDLKTIDFLQLAIEGFGNEIAATTGAGVGASGTPGTDTILYTGTDTQLAPLASDVEHFDGSGSAASYAVTGNALPNIIRVGPGANTITTGGGADSVRGTLADLAGDTITDFSSQDEVVILGVQKKDLSVSYGAGAGGAAVVTLGGAALTIGGPAVAGFDPAQGGATFVLEDVSGGVRLTARAPLTPVLAINAGGPLASNLVLRDQAINFVSDLPTAPKVGFTVTGSSNAYSNSKSLTTDFPGTDLDPLHAYERSSPSTGKWGYAIAVDNGTYLVDLIYAEIYHGFVTGADPAGLRQFDVFIENVLVQDNYDIIADAGAPGAEVIKSYEVTVTDGVLNIEFLKEVDQAKLSGLAVWAMGAGATPPPPGTTPPDTTPPVVVSIAVENPPSVQDDERLATVVLADAGGGFSLAALQALTGAELVFTGIVPKAVSAPAVVLSNGGQTATLSYKLTPPDAGWPAGQGQVAIAAGAYKDAAGNGTAAATGGFVFDPSPGPDPVKGALVFALNAGGGAVTATDGTVFEADTGAGWTGSTPYADGAFGGVLLPGGDYNRDGVTNGDDAVYATERYGGAPGGAPMTYARTGIEPGAYILTLKLAEIYNPNFQNDARVFSVSANGVTVVQDLDLFDVVSEADKAYDIEVPVTVGADGLLTLSFQATADNAKVGAIALHKAVAVGPGPGPGPGPNPFGAVGPQDDLDGDGIPNAQDADVDGDGTPNVNDPFAYDAQNGALIAAGASIALDFGTNGTPYQNGFTGLLQAGIKGTSALKAFNEETGTARVEGGKLIVIASNGDTGGSNDPQDDYQLGVKNRAFTVESRVENPFLTHAAANFDQLGLQVSLDSTDMAKFVFGFSPGTVEFSARGDDVETKAMGGNQPLPAGLSLAGFSAVDLKLVVTGLSPTQATIVASATFLDAAGNPIAGATGVSFGSLTVSGALAAAIHNETVGVGAGVTQTQVGGPDKPFNAVYDSFKVTAAPVSDPGPGPIDPGPGPGDPGPIVGGRLADALGAFGSQGDLDTSKGYGTGVIGAAKLEVMLGVTNIEASNFGNNSFKVTNLGDKKISAIFIDVTGALYPDSIFDPDGKGGDTVAKPWAVNSAGNTGGYVTGSGYFLPGPDPIPNSGGSGGASNGGFRGAMVKFNPGVSGGFEKGEVVGFSGDMDPNSIAGMAKSGSLGVDTNAVSNWDVGGISGHEIIGSRFTVLFDDGTTATGHLISDTSASGSHALATQAQGAAAPTLTVGGVPAGGLGTYGVTAPSVIVTGEPGQTVRITLTKGFNPVGNQNAGIADLVADRLERYDFPVSNNFDSQSVDVVIGANGRFDATRFFDYDDALANSKPDFPGSDVKPIGFVAAVIDPATGLPLSPITRPLYLTNQGGAVPGDPDYGRPQGHWLEQGGAVKVQFEDIVGDKPPPGWTYVPPNQGNAGAQGAHYYWKSQSGSTAVEAPASAGIIRTQILIQEAGNYTLRVRATRDTNDPADARNDIWVRVNGDTEKFTLSTASPLVKENGFVKLFGAGTKWGYSQKFDKEGTTTDPNAVLKLAPGLYTIEFAGRSQGYHMDFFELKKGTGTLLNAPNSTFVETSPPGDTTSPPGDTTPPPGDTTPPPGDTTPPPGDPDPVERVRVEASGFTRGTGANEAFVLGSVRADIIGNGGSDLFAIEGLAGQEHRVRDFGADDVIDLSALFGGAGSVALVQVQTVSWSGRSHARITVDRDGDGAFEQALLLSDAGGLTLEGMLAAGSLRLAPAGTGDTTPPPGDTTPPPGDTTPPPGDTTPPPGGTTPPPGGTTERVFAIKASSDDWEKYGSGTSFDLELGFNEMSDGRILKQYVGLRFSGVDIPAGAVIEDAYLRFQAIDTQVMPASFKIQIEGSKTAATYTGTSKPNVRSYADEFVWKDVEGWTAGETYRTPDISDLVETVAGQGGVSGGALAFQITAAAGSDGYRFAHAFDSKSGAAPELVLVFDADSLL